MLFYFYHFNLQRFPLHSSYFGVMYIDINNSSVAPFLQNITFSKHAELYALNYIIIVIVFYNTLFTSHLVFSLFLNQLQQPFEVNSPTHGLVLFVPYSVRV